MISIEISKSTKINIQLIENKINSFMTKNGFTYQFQLKEQYKKPLMQMINKHHHRFSVKKIKSIMYDLQMTDLKQSQLKIMGGGGCCSNQQPIKEYNFNEIKMQDEQLFEDQQNREFEQNYKKLTNQQTINQCIEKNSQVKIQKTLLKQCLIDQLIHSDNQVNFYQLEIQDIFETYLLLESTKNNQKTQLQQEELNRLLEEIQTMESYSNDFPVMELMFYVKMFKNLNQNEKNYDEQQKNAITKVQEFIISLGKFRNDKDFQTLNLIAEEVSKNIFALDKKKELSILKYYIDIKIRTIKQFSEKFYKIEADEEILLYSKIFLELNRDEDMLDIIILTLIRINYILEKFEKQKQKQINYQESYKILAQNLLNGNIIEFLNEIMQKSEFFSKEVFLIFSVENIDYRYISLSILLKINTFFASVDSNQEIKQYLLDYLCNKFLTEQQPVVRVLFEFNLEFAQYFNENINNINFKQRILNFDIQRKKILLQYGGKQLVEHERSINSVDDIASIIADNAIKKWERDIKYRQKQNIAQKDDVLLEIKDLYINQLIKYINGNPIFQKVNNPQHENESKDYNALQDVFNLHLKPDYSYFTKHINAKKEQQEFDNLAKRCQILGIIAEGGTGKSMFMKKIETLLIENLSKNNSESESTNFLPLMIKCNSLDSQNPSLESYLKVQGINEEQLKSLKQCDRNKLILLDGYDEYTGDYFNVYNTLKIDQWRNTKVIVSSRIEKMTIQEARSYFCKFNDVGQRDEMSYSIMSLQEFKRKDIDDYSERYFKQCRNNQSEQIKQDLKNMNECLLNSDIEKLLYLPINLYLFTRMLINSNQKDIDIMKNNISDQVGIQEIFFNDQFQREAQSFVDANVKDMDLIKDKSLQESIKDCYFDYFQTAAIQMFLKKGVVSGNFLQIQKSEINFEIQGYIKSKLDTSLVQNLHNKIKTYINSKIITRVKTETEIKKKARDQTNQNLNQFIEFKHKSLFEYFVARAMKYDFDIHRNNIPNLSMKELKNFRINQKTIMNVGFNQSEQMILIKLYKLIKNEIESDEFYSNYHLDEIEKNNRFIQYLKKSQIQTENEISQIDNGASNLISALFISKFAFSKLKLNKCSFTKAYISNPKSNTINFYKCNLQNAYLKNSSINYDSCNTQYANFDTLYKVYDTQNIYSFNKIIWGKNDLLYSISKSGFINNFKLNNQNVMLLMSKQLSQQPINQILFYEDDTLLVSSQYTLFLINSNNFDILESYKFTYTIVDIQMIKKSIIVTFENQEFLQGTFKNGFQKINIHGMGSAFNSNSSILVSYSNNLLFLYDSAKKFQCINTIKAHDKTILSIAYSSKGDYLATGSEDKTCKIWNAEKGFELINTIESHTEGICSVAFSTNGKYFSTGSRDKTCKIWNAEKNFGLINTIQSHTGVVNSVVFLPHGKYLATSSEDNTCKIWNIEKDFLLVNAIQSHSSHINSVAFSPNGKFLVTGSSDNTNKIWNVEKGYQLIYTIEGHTNRVNSVAFSSDGKYLATGSKDNTCKIWDVEKGFELINTIQGHNGAVFSVTFSPNGKYIATSSEDKTSKIWNLEKGFELIKTNEGHANGVCFVTFSPHGKYLATSSYDKTCKIWNTEKDFELINSFKGHSSDIHGIGRWVYSVAFSPNGKYLVTSAFCQLKLWSAEKDFQFINKIQGHLNWIVSVAFSPDGKYLATGSNDQACEIRNVEKGFELLYTIQGHSSAVNSVAYSPDGKILSTVSSDNTCKIWNTEKGFESINTIQGHISQVLVSAFSPNGKILVTGSSDYSLKIWNAEKGFELIKTTQSHQDQVSYVAFSPDGKYLASCTYNLFYIWNVEKDFQIILTFWGHHDWVNTCIFSPDGRYLVTGSSDNTSKMWDAEKGFKHIKDLHHSETVYSVAFSPDGKYLITCSDDKTFKIWNVEKGLELINTIQGHTEGICFVAFSPQGKYLATGSQDNTCKIWNTEKDFQLINTIEGHTKGITSVAFSPDGKYLATGSEDKTCKIWNAENGFDLISTIQSHTDLVCSVVFSPDGRILITSSRDKTCRIWNAEQGFETFNSTKEFKMVNKNELQNVNQQKLDEKNVHQSNKYGQPIESKNNSEGERQKRDGIVNKQNENLVQFENMFCL